MLDTCSKCLCMNLAYLIYIRLNLTLTNKNTLFVFCVKHLIWPTALIKPYFGLPSFKFGDPSSKASKHLTSIQDANISISPV